jgi:hypothetical protein
MNVEENEILFLREDHTNETSVIQTIQFIKDDTNEA